MKAIILAAGQGVRLRPLTDDRPKCLVEYHGKSMIDHILGAFERCGLSDICMVKGYRADVLTRPGVREYINENYATTNMVSTLFCAEEEMNDDVIISYADIVYRDEILQALIDAPGDFSVVVDREWRSLWEARMEDPLRDAETLKLNADGCITELGQMPRSFEDIEGQYIGLLKISKNVISKVRSFYHSLDRSDDYDGKDFDNMYMTTFIQRVINDLMPVKAVFIDGGWHEVDSVSDLDVSVELD